MNVGDYNLVQEHLPLSPPWDQAHGLSNSKFVLAKLKNKSEFQNYNRIISVSLKNRFKLAKEKGSPTTSSKFWNV